jgi:hypothetical protein
VPERLIRDAHRDEGEADRYERMVDAVLMDSFPASDPPAWTAAITRPAPSAGHSRIAAAVGDVARRTVARPGTLDVSLPHGSRRTAADAIVSLVGAAGLALLVPGVMLLLGLPIVLALRGVLHVVEWVVAVVR